MRSVVNISLPQSLNREVDQAVKKGDFASKSEFFRYLFRLWKQQELVADVRESEKEFEAGEGKVLRSLADLR